MKFYGFVEDYYEKGNEDISVTNNVLLFNDSFDDIYSHRILRVVWRWLRFALKYGWLIKLLTSLVMTGILIFLTIKHRWAELIVGIMVIM